MPIPWYELAVAFFLIDISCVLILVIRQVKHNIQIATARHIAKMEAELPPPNQDIDDAIQKELNDAQGK